MANAFKIDSRNVLNLLKQLPREVVSKRGGPVRAALRKGAVLIQNQVKQNLVGGLDPEATMLLLKSVVVTRGKEPTSGRGERYLVRIKRATYLRGNGKPVTTLKSAQIKEYGSEKQAAEPFIVPAFKSKAREAIEVTVKSLVTSVDAIVKRLGKK